MLKKLLFLFPLLVIFFASCDSDENLPVPNTDEYVAYRYPENNFNLATPDSIIFMRTNNSNVLVGYNAAGNLNAYLSWEGPASPGQYDLGYAMFFSQGKYMVSRPGSTDSKINLSEFGTAGNHIRGTYLGLLKDSTNNQNGLAVINFLVRNQ